MAKHSQTLQLQPELQRTLDQLAAVIGSSATPLPWLLGGSCGLLLQGVQLERSPRDIDLYADGPAISGLDEQLRHSFALLDGPELNETRMYRSTLSHYQGEDCTIELVGDFEVRARESYYRVHVDRTLYMAATMVELNGHTVRLMPLEHELIFNLLRDRADRYEAIAEQLRQQPERHEPLLRQLIDHNGFHPQLMQRILRLAGLQA
ncbi:hypothetical protein [Paenibacillus sp. WLX2291]|uniref:hypothetical protein n=1 Tax=Paenibacillus sp. WLX2291 TaxID=3296934 RepID=UPI003984519D